MLCALALKKVLVLLVIEWCFNARENCDDKMQEFLKKCFYHSGQYNSEADFKQLDAKLKVHEVLDIYIWVSLLSLFCIFLWLLWRWLSLPPIFIFGVLSTVMHAPNFHAFYWLHTNTESD